MVMPGVLDNQFVALVPISVPVQGIIWKYLQYVFLVSQWHMNKLTSYKQSLSASLLGVHTVWSSESLYDQL